jgi:hypothetical protein
VYEALKPLVYTALTEALVAGALPDPLLPPRSLKLLVYEALKPLVYAALTEALVAGALPDPLLPPRRPAAARRSQRRGRRGEGLNTALIQPLIQP